MNPTRGLIVGSIVGLLLGAILGGGLHLLMKFKRSADVRRGWNLAPIVVAEKALEAGSVVTMTDVAQRSIPEQFITASMVKPSDASSVVNQPLRYSVEAGEPLQWAYFETAGGTKPFAKQAEEAVIRAACAAELKERGNSVKPMRAAEIRKSLGGGP